MQPEIDEGDTCRILQVRWVCEEMLGFRSRVPRSQGMANQIAAMIWGARLSAKALPGIFWRFYMRIGPKGR